ncbi:ATP-grasp domain-containing protein [Alkalimarinus coralli]|uniref:ATP-grasp domain-containing protein n=1 Tax=Alkalimarinus coralli TaxID=2935863 RepID=UPI00202AFD41|nr:hypothetical protein [Alkalimarinus coralli]
MKSTLVILKNSAGGFPQLLDEVESILTESFYKSLDSSKINVVEALYAEYQSIVAPLITANNNPVYIFYCSSQYPSYYNYIYDTMTDAASRGAILIPSLELLRCHENKLFQELHKDRLGIATPKSWLLGSVEDIEYLINNGLQFPVIAKLPHGFGSSTVSKVDNIDELKKYANEHLVPTIKPRKNIFKYKEAIKKYTDKYPMRTGSIVLQEFIPAQTHDWKVLVIGNKVFSLKRYTRKNDFRASGSGNFSGDETPPIELVDFAYGIKKKLNAPWVSLDIIESNNGYLVIEYQSIHFGPYTVTASKKHFLLIDGAWELVYKPVCFEKELALVLNQIVQSN